MIPVNEPLLDGNEKKYLQECIDAGWVSSEGPFVKKFEEQFAHAVGRRHGVAVCNGSAALAAAVAALGIGEGDEVIMPAFTIVSCANAIIRAGATPVAVDCDSRTWNMDVSKIEERLTSKTKAIMAVHIYGLPTDMRPLMEIAERHGLKIIEDAAQAIGLEYNGKTCGSFGALSCFSFYPNKLVTAGEGGMVVTDNDELAERCRSLRNLCFQRDNRFVHQEMGWNMRMTNLQAAVGLAQLEKLDRSVKRKKEIGARYNLLLEGIKGVTLPLPETGYAQNIYWVYGIVLNEETGLEAKDAMQKLGKRHIGTRPFFWPMHKQPVFQKMGLFENESCPVAERLARNGFYLPSGLALRNGQIEEVCQHIKEILE